MVEGGYISSHLTLFGPRLHCTTIIVRVMDNPLRLFQSASLLFSVLLVNRSVETYCFVGVVVVAARLEACGWACALNSSWGGTEATWR